MHAWSRLSQAHHIHRSESKELRQGNKDRVSLDTPRCARCRLEELQAALREAETYIEEDVVARDAELESARAEAAAARVCSCKWPVSFRGPVHVLRDKQMQHLLRY